MIKDSKKTLRFSKFLVEKSKESKIAVYHTLKSNPPIIIKKQFWLEFKKNPRNYQSIKLFKNLRKLNLLIESPKTDDIELKKIRKGFLNNLSKTPSTLYVILTENCNLKCIYCPFSKNKKTQKDRSMMSFSIFVKGINFWLKSLSSKFDGKRTYYIIFYGGEPLLNINVLKKSLDYIQLLKSKNKLPSNLKILLDTNGVLLNKKIADLLKRYDVEVTIALDDFTSINDKYRIDSKKQGTLTRVTQTLKILQDFKIVTYLSTALTPENLNKIKNFPKQMEKLKIKSFGINIIRGYCFKNNKEYQRMSAEKMVDLFWAIKDSGIIEFQTYKRYLAYKSKNFSLLNCGGFGEHIVLRANGEIGNCPWTKNYSLDNIFVKKGYHSFTKNNFLHTRKKDLPLFNEECLGCEAIRICGGRCIWAEDESGLKDQSFCHLSKGLMNTFIWRYGVLLNNEK